MLIRVRICKSYYKFLISDAIKNENIFEKASCNIETKSKHIFNYYKLIKTKNNNFNYLYIMVIPKFFKSSIKCRIVTIQCNT